MRRVAAVLFAGCVTYTVSAADLLQCLPPDELHGIVRNGITGAGNAAVTDEILPELEGVEWPPDAVFVGSSFSDSSNVTVFRTELAREAAFAQAVAGAKRAGWAEMGGADLVGRVGAAVNMPSPEAARATMVLCKNDRPMTLSARVTENTSYLYYRLASGAGGCAPAPRAIVTRSAAVSSLERYFPSLRFPDDPATGRPAVARAGGSGGSGQSRYSSTQVSIAMPLGELAAFLGAQIAEGGWAPDSSWTGALTAGSTWTRKSVENTDLMAVLDLAARSPTSFDVTFRLVALD